jgi:hypothetical protein
MALRFAGFDPVHVRNWIPEDEPAPFLTGLAAVRINEEQMIQHDAGVFGDWQLIRRNLAGTAVFYGPRGKRITLMNVNRHSVELTLGVDLLYYSEEFRSYVLVQYKRMRREGASFAYRPIDESYNREIGRMRDFCRDYPPAPLGPNLREFRLSPMPFYLTSRRRTLVDTLVIPTSLRWWGQAGLTIAAVDIQLLMLWRPLRACAPVGAPRRLWGDAECD